LRCNPRTTWRFLQASRIVINQGDVLGENSLDAAPDVGREASAEIGHEATTRIMSNLGAGCPYQWMRCYQGSGRQYVDHPFPFADMPHAASMQRP